MNVKRYTARTSREALALVRSELGADAVVLSTRPSAEGVEVLAMAPEGMQQIEAATAQSAPGRASTPAPAPAKLPSSAASPKLPSSATSPRPVAAAPAPRQASAAALPAAPAPVVQPVPPGAARAPQAAAPRAYAESPVEQDVETLGMSTLSFQDYVRERMLKRRQEELDVAGSAMPRADGAAMASPTVTATVADPIAAAPRRAASARHAPPLLSDEIELADVEPNRVTAAAAAARRDHSEMMGELRSVKQLIEERFGMLAFMEKLHRNPRQAELAQKLLDTGLSPALIRKVVQGLPADVGDELAWATAVLERNLLTDEDEPALEDAGGVYALIGSTGVGKTTSTAKIAAAFAAHHGAVNLGLITLDAYRVAAHEQLRAYGRILGVPVHTAHDRASLEDLLDLLSAKRMVLIDTAGMAQRDTRTRELLEMLSHKSIQKLLVVNAAAQGETVEDVMVAYGASSCRGVIVSKLDEAMKLGPALDGLIRHRCKVVGVANGQRVPEDWHRLSAAALVQHALRGRSSSSWRLEAGEVNLVFAGRPQAAAATTLRM